MGSPEAELTQQRHLLVTFRSWQNGIGHQQKGTQATEGDPGRGGSDPEADWPLGESGSWAGGGLSPEG